MNLTELQDRTGENGQAPESIWGFAKSINHIILRLPGYDSQESQMAESGTMSADIQTAGS